MNKLYLALLGILLIPVALALSASHNLPEEGVHGDQTPVTLMVHGAAIAQHIVIGELLPDGAQLTSWSVTGAAEPRDQITFVQDGQSLVWEFTASITTPAVTYTVLLPTSGERATFDAVYALPPDQFGHQVDTLSLVAPAPVPAPVQAVPVELEQPAPLSAPGSQNLWPFLTFAGVLLIFTALSLGRVSHLRLGAQATSDGGVQRRSAAVVAQPPAVITELHNELPTFKHEAPLHHPVHHAPAHPVVQKEPEHHEPVHHTPVHHEPVHHPVHHEPAHHKAAAPVDLVLNEPIEHLAYDDAKVYEKLEHLTREALSIRFAHANPQAD